MNPTDSPPIPEEKPRLKLLFLANRVPYPPYRGDKLKIWNLAKELSKKHELHLITFAQTLEELEYAKPLKAFFTEVKLVYLPKWKSALTAVVAAPFTKMPLQVLYFQSAAMHGELGAMLQNHSYDAVHVQHLRMAPYLQHQNALPRILDLPDAFSLYWQRKVDMPGGVLQRAFRKLEQKRLLRFEGVLKDYNLTLACSREDVAWLREKHPEAHIDLLQNGVNLETFDPKRKDYSEDKVMLFTGNMDYAPNVDAVQYFVKNMFPQILTACPSARFIIAGQRPVEEVKKLASEKVEVTGFIEHISALYDEAAVVVAPLRFGAGTQNKVLEAMAMAVPVVSTDIGFQGLGIESGEGVYCEPDEALFINRVIELLQNGTLRETVGNKGRAVASERYGWPAIAEQLINYVRTII